MREAAHLYAFYQINYRPQGKTKRGERARAKSERLYAERTLLGRTDARKDVRQYALLQPLGRLYQID